MMRHITTILVACAVILGSATVEAGGYDTPILYTARHMGMGGAAIGYVDDPSAVFHNPAGLAHTKFFSATGNFSPLFGKIQASPSEGDQNAESELTFAPFFLVGASIRATDWLTFGLGAYPVASAGATYKYDNSVGIPTEDTTKLVFIEVAPAVAIDLPLGFKLGASYRATIITFDRYQGNPDGSGGNFDLALSGTNFAGFKVGLQWTLLPFIKVGVVYRHKTVTTVEADSSSLLSFDWGKTSMDFTLPSKIGFGVRGDLGPLGAVLDVEYGFNSQNEKSTIKAEEVDGDGTLELDSIFQWKDAITVRTGLEFSMLGLLKLRGGYVFDDTTSNIQFPSAFGTPPAPNHSITAGVGVSLLDFVQVNVAYAYRFGSVDIVSEDFEGRDPAICLTCSKEGEYWLTMHAAYVDVGVKF